MRMLRTFLSRLFDVLVRDRRDARLDEEVRGHLDLLTADFERTGLSRADAVLAARRAFGGVDQVKAAYRDQRGWPALDALLQDGRFAWRLLFRDGRFSATVIAVLGLGIGVSHLFYTLTYAHTIRGLPMPQVDAVLHVSTLDIQANDRGVSYLDFADLRRDQRTFEDLAAFANAPVALGEEGRAPERVDATYATAAAFSIARVVPLLGRVLESTDDRPGSPAVVVLAERLWRSRYDRDPSVLGRVVEVNETAATVVGVLSDASGFPSAAALWLPLSHLPSVQTAPRGARTLRVFGRLRESATAQEGRMEIEALGDRLAESFPETNRGIRMRVVPLNERFVASRAGWWPFMLAGAIVIAVACINVGNLMMVHTARRVRELAIRTSLGASRGRLVRQLLLEATAVSSVGAALGLAISRLGVWSHQSNIPEPFHPYWARYHMDTMVWLGLVVMLGTTVLISAVTPALLASRVEPTTALKEGGRAETGRPLGGALTTGTLGLQLALALVLLTKVGLTTLEAQLNVIPTDVSLSDPGVLTASFTLSAPRYASAGARRDFQTRVMERLRALPSVSAVALASHLPLAGALERRLQIADRPIALGDILPTVWAVEATPTYFDLLRLAPVRGRGLNDTDARPGTAGIVVNQRFEALHFAGADPVGARIALDTTGSSDTEWWTIVGVIPDVRQYTGPDIRPLVYLPHAVNVPSTTMVLIRAAEATASATREAFRELDASVPLHQMQTLAAARWNAEWIGRTSGRLALTVTLAAALLALAGLYAVLSHRIVLRTREIGVRMVLGAGPRQIAWLVGATVRNALLLGLSVGLTGVLAWTRAFSPERANSASAVGRIVIATAIALVVMAAVGSALPARRAALLPPGDALRRDS